MTQIIKVKAALKIISSALHEIVDIAKDVNPDQQTTMMPVPLDFIHQIACVTKDAENIIKQLEKDLQNNGESDIVAL